MLSLNLHTNRSIRLNRFKVMAIKLLNTKKGWFTSGKHALEPKAFAYPSMLLLECSTAQSKEWLNHELTGKAPSSSCKA